MILFAQAGIGAAAAGLEGLYTIAFLLGLAIPALFLILWYAPECLQLIQDLITGRNLPVEHERDQRMEGRLFDPQCVPANEQSPTTSHGDLEN